MFSVSSICHDHKDLIHDVAYDYHGRRIATCSSDENVKIWDLNDNGMWILSSSWKAHYGSVWKVDWAHPEFGQIIVTCSFDRTAVIWEEIISDGNSGGGGGRGQKHWVKRCSLVDSRSNVTDVKFTPKHLGLMLATCSQDGVVRIYEAPDIMNLSQWNLQHEITSSKLRCSCIAWNPSSYHSTMLAVGSDDANAVGPKISIYEYKDGSRKWIKVDSLTTFNDPVFDLQFAPNIGRSYHLLAIASKNVHIVSMKPLQTGTDSDVGSKFESRQIAQFEEHSSQVWRVSWNITGTVLASSGQDGTVRLWKANYMNNWKCAGILKHGEEGGILQTFPKSDDRYY